MLNKFILFFCFVLALSFPALAQENQPKTKQDTEKLGDLKTEIDSTQLRKPINPLSPAKAAFYSAVLPGLGQAYNKKYWKIPIVYGALGAGIYFYTTNNKNYNRTRDAYKRRLAGFTDDEFQGRLTDDGLLERQKTFRRNKELSLLITVGLYALNIIDANVDAHLLQFNVDEDLSLKPHYEINEIDKTGNFGLTLNFKIN
ncbi:DUF5683 domain-containing protein [Lacinutrix sp. MedPE-SW]|uniref:DUF5683 domain-containing protein n=1 Tax=Lacinutrix sp. MedPE-SW TaxID=1860087 RepID=UPI0009120AF6|nr:DUF5683 domain-containing protein [Lacinutrix sp. MedPE-SW]OIQ23031.1 MAG: hypothetical protein BM549_05790 [Lacinutrix sp. MedPE-SW]